MASTGGQGAFLPTTQVWDVSNIYDTDVNSAEFKELIVRLYQNLNRHALMINIKDTGYYAKEEFVNGQAFFPDPALDSSTSSMPVMRQVIRKVIDFGPLLDTAPKQTAHGITLTSNFTFTRIYGAASDTTAPFNYIPIPYASPVAASNIELQVDSTFVTITTGSNRTNFDTTYVVLEYLNQ